MTDSPAELDVREGKPPRRVSFVWLVPVLALLISLGVAYQNYAARGTLIEIAFDGANGIKAGETVIKYRDVDVGRVETVKFDEGLNVVLVNARMDNDIAPYLDDDASFWVVQPEVSVRGITGLDTVLSGVYVEGTWDTEQGVQQYAFTGLEEPPLNSARVRGTEIVLRSRDGSSLTTGAPLLHKGIRVGYLEEPELSPDGRNVVANAFLEAPYDQRVTTNSRFWDTSGFSVSLGAGGVSLNVSSLASLIEGGIAFDTVVSGGQPIRDGQVFDIFPSEDAARENLFTEPDRETLDVAVLFDGTVQGLTTGADVRFQGLRVGQVRDLSAVVVESRDRAAVQLRVVMAIEPQRLGLGAESTPEDAAQFLSDFVRQGLRARLATGNILSGALIVELLEVPDAGIGVMDMEADPYPIIPATEPAITDVADTADDVLNRINNLPIEELLQSAIDLMDGIEVLVTDDGVRQAPEALTALLDDTRALVTSDDITAIPGELRQAIADLGDIVGAAAEADVAGALSAAIERTSNVAATIDAATVNLPAIMAELEALGAKANALDVEGLLAEANSTLDSIDTLIAQEATQALPGQVGAVLDTANTFLTSEDLVAIPQDLRDTINRLSGLVTDLDEAGAVDSLTAAITGAQETVASIDAATENLPQISAELEALVSKANALDLEGLVAEATETLDSIDRLVGSQSTQDIPASLSAALDEVRLFLTEVREGGAITNVNAALAAANEAAQAIEDAAESLPALAARANRLADQTGAVLDSYSDRSRFNAETLATLRDIQEAADAISSLARTIQRNPSALLTGR